MSASKFLAVDFGAETGRAIVGILEEDRISLEEVHRFPNVQTRIDGHLHWDIHYLFAELKKGLSLAVQKGHGDIESIGIDTWGVDFGLIDRKGEVIGSPFAYRDSRTNGMMERAFDMIPREEIYSSTGIQFMQINTLFQLYNVALNDTQTLDNCDTLLFMPDLFNYFLTGKKVSEYTIASTSQLLNARTQRWDETLFSKLGLPIHIMAPIVHPCTIIGKLRREIADEVGLNKGVDIIAVGCHDTASAVAAVPSSGNDWAFLSSGTWSLLGVESDQPLINEESLRYNFTNEGGIGASFRFLRNVMGLWLLQETRRSWQKQGKSYSYATLATMAATSPPFRSIINPDDDSFLNPPDMPQAIQAFCKRTGQLVPEREGEFVRCIFESLAFKFKIVLERICSITKRNIRTLHVVGGGSHSDLLNQCTADACGICVSAGPVEATALGNVLVQAIAKGKVQSLQKGREIVARSFPLKSYQPQNSQRWNDALQRNQNSSSILSQ